MFLLQHTFSSILGPFLSEIFRFSTNHWLRFLIDMICENHKGAIVFTKSNRSQYKDKIQMLLKTHRFGQPMKWPLVNIDTCCIYKSLTKSVFFLQVKANLQVRKFSAKVSKHFFCRMNSKRNPLSPYVKYYETTLETLGPRVSSRPRLVWAWPSIIWNNIWLPWVPLNEMQLEEARRNNLREKWLSA